MTPTRLFRRSGLSAAALIALSAPAFAADYSFDSGSFNPGVTAPASLTAADTLNIVAGGAKYLSSFTLTNGGTVNWKADTLYMSSLAIDNNGLWNASSDDSFSYYSGSRPVFNNVGTFRKSAGTGATSIGGISFVNSGIVEAQTGSIDFNGGAASFLAGTQFIGAGANIVTNDAVFSGAFTSSNLSLRGGTSTGNAAVVNGSVDFVGGTLAGTWDVAAGQQLLLQTGGNKFINGTVTNHGTVRWLGGTDNLYQSSSTIDNRGVFDVQGNLTLYYYSGGTPNVINTGTVQTATGSSLTVSGNAGFVNNGGTLAAAAGSTINFAGSNATFNNGTLFTGAGVNVVTGTARFVDGFTSQNLVLQSGTFYGGDGATAGSKAVLGGTVSYTGGSFSGNWEIGTGQTLAANAGGTKFVSSASIVNKGTFAWQASGDSLYMSSSSLENQGLFEARENGTLVYYSGGRPVFTNTAAGTVQAAAGKTLTVGGVAFVNDGGTLNALAGGSINYAGDNASFNAGTRFTGAGVNVVTGTARFVDGFTSQNLVLQSGTSYGGDGVNTGSKAVLGGSVSFTGGALSGNWEIAAGQTLAADAGGDKFLTSATLVNKGTFAWQTSGGNLYMSSSSLENQGLFEARENGTLVYYTGSRPVFTNTAAGTVQAAAGKTLTVGGVAFVNDGGTLNALAGGSIVYAGNNATFNAGTRFTGAGRNVVTGDARFIDGFTSQNLVLQSGAFYGGDGVTAGSKAVLNGTVGFVGGSLRGNWEVAAGQTLSADAGFDKFVANAALVNKGTVALQSADNLYLSSSSIDNQGRFDLKADAALIYYTGAQPSFVNNGLLVKSGGSGTSDLSSLALTNNGTIEVRSGTLRLPNDFANAGTVMGSGTVASSTLTNNGHLAPGSGVGTLGLAGNFVQGAAGTFDVDLAALGSTDLFLVSGNAMLGGSLLLHCVGSCHFAVGDEVVILDANGELSGSFASVALEGFASGAFDVVYDTALDRVLLHVTQETVAAVPEPGSGLLLLGGAALLGIVVRRRQRR